MSMVQKRDSIVSMKSTAVTTVIKGVETLVEHNNYIHKQKKGNQTNHSDLRYLTHCRFSSVALRWLTLTVKDNKKWAKKVASCKLQPR